MPQWFFDESDPGKITFNHPAFYLELDLVPNQTKMMNEQVRFALFDERAVVYIDCLQHAIALIRATLPTQKE